MKLRFFRRRFIEADIPRGNSRAFEVAVGLEAPVNQLSGMTVNLTQVDEWLSQLASHQAFENEWSAIENFRIQLDIAAKAVSAKIVRVELKEDRRWWAFDENGSEIGRREASRKVEADGRSTPIWLETLTKPDGSLLQTREVAYDGNTVRAITV